MELHLSAAEARALRIVLSEAISDLSPEIADTDNASYRMMLRRRRDLLRGVRDRLVDREPERAEAMS